MGDARAGQAGRADAHRHRAVLAAAAPGVGMLIYSAFIWRLTGDPLGWLKAHGAWGREYQGLAALVGDRVDIIANAGVLGLCGLAAARRDERARRRVRARRRLACGPDTWPGVGRVHPGLYSSAAGGGRTHLGRTILVGAVSRVPLDGRRRSPAASRGVARLVCGDSGAQRGHVLHLAAALLNDTLRFSPLLREFVARDEPASMKARYNTSQDDEVAALARVLPFGARGGGRRPAVRGAGHRAGATAGRRHRRRFRRRRSRPRRARSSRAATPRSTP